MLKQGNVKDEDLKKYKKRMTRTKVMQIYSHLPFNQLMGPIDNIIKRKRGFVALRCPIFGEQILHIDVCDVCACWKRFVVKYSLNNIKKKLQSSHTYVQCSSEVQLYNSIAETPKHNLNVALIFVDNPLETS